MPASKKLEPGVGRVHARRLNARMPRVKRRSNARKLVGDFLKIFCELWQAAQIVEDY